MLFKCVFCAPFCAPPACPSVPVHQFLLPQGNRAPLHFVPAMQLDFLVLGGTLSAHPSEPRTFSDGPKRDSESIKLTITEILPFFPTTNM